MKKEAAGLYILRLALTLLLITAAVAAALAGVNAITAPRIAETTAQKTRDAIETVLPGGGEPVESFTDPTGLVSRVYASDAGYAVEVKPNGFGGTITMMVGIDKSGTVLGIRIISHSETASLGAVAAADTSAGTAFRDQFLGVGGSVSVAKDGGQIDAVTGATVTSRAVCAGVNAALDCVASFG